MTIRFAAIGFEHGHIYGQVQVMLDAGAELVSFHDVDPSGSPASSRHFHRANKLRLSSRSWKMRLLT